MLRECCFWLRFFLLLLVAPYRGWSAVYQLPSSSVVCAKFLQNYFQQMQQIHQQGKSWYFNQRRLSDYVAIFGEQWLQEAQNLKEEQWWLDSGAGGGLALIDYLAKYSGKAAGISYALDKWDRYWVDQAMQEFSGRFDFYLGLLETPLRLWPQAPQVAMLTDLYGPLAYTHAPDQVLQQYAFLLKPWGKAYLLIPENSLQLYQADGQQGLTWAAWLAQGQGLQLLQEKILWANPHPTKPLGRLLVVQRTTAAVKLPPLIALPAKFKFNIPPQRGFKLRAVD